MITQQSRVLHTLYGYLKLQDLPKINELWTGEGVSPVSISSPSLEDAVTVVFTNGKEIVCSPCQEFKTMQKRMAGSGWTQAKDLKKTHLIQLTENAPSVNAAAFNHYRFLSKLTHEELGTLVGLLYSGGNGVCSIDIPFLRVEARQEFIRILKKVDEDLVIENYFDRTDRVKVYTLNENLIEEIKTLQVRDRVPEEAFYSKPFAKGFLKAIFTFSLVGTQMFTLRAEAKSNLLKDVQELLLLFNINSSYSPGFKASNLIVSKNNCYRLAVEIGVFNAEILFSGVDYTKFLKYNNRIMEDMRYASVHNVYPVKNQIEMVKVDIEQFMFDGVIAK